MRELRRVDFLVYPRALAVYAKNPSVALAPLLAGLIDVLVVRLGSGSGVTPLISLLVNALGMSVAIIAADAAWRRQHARLDFAWNEARRKMSDILMAALGVGFVYFAVSLIGGILGPLQSVAQAIVFGFLVYALPAAAIGGVPGVMSLQISVERARANPATTITLTLALIALYAASLLSYGSVMISVSLFTGSPTMDSILETMIRALFAGYGATILAKVYGDVSYGRRF